MNREQDFEPFRKLLDQLCATFDRPAAKDELVQAYWDALKFAPFAEIERNVKRIIRMATRRTRWPKPMELRDEMEDEPTQRSASHTATVKAAEALNAQTWKELEACDPALYALEIGIARCARILATEHESTPQFAETRRLDWELRQRRRALFTERIQRTP